MPCDSETPLKHTTLVCAFRNRIHHLSQTLPTWLRWGFHQVILLNFGGTDSISLKDPRVLIVTATTPETWHLSRALNLLLPLIETRYTLKLDADIRLGQPPLPPAPHSFTTGRWQTHRQGQSHCNGSFYIETAAWKASNGHDSLIKSYGWEDEDFYMRFQKSGLARRYFPAACLTHITHSHASTTENTIQRNAAATELRANVSHAKRSL